MKRILFLVFGIIAIWGFIISSNVYAKESQIVGRVFKPDGTLLTDSRITQISINLSSSSTTNNLNVSQSVYHNGTYCISADIPDGDYTLTADASCFTGEYANSKPQVIHITNGKTINTDLYLTIPTITGRVLKPDGTVFKPENPDGYYMREYVELIRIHTDKYVERKQVGLDGSYCIGADLPTGSYILRVNTECVAINGSFTDSIERLVNVTQGKSINLDLKLTNPSVRGRLLKLDNTPFNSGRHLDLVLRLESVSDPNYKGVYTYPNDDGSFRLGGFVPTGDYYIVTNFNSPYIPYLGSAPIKIHLTSGETVEKNITLTYALEVINTNISNNQANVELKPSIGLIFNKSLGIGPNYNKICISNGGEIVSGEISLYGENTIHDTFKLIAELKQNTDYTITIPEGAFIDCNKKYNRPFSLSFSTKKADVITPEEKISDESLEVVPSGFILPESTLHYDSEFPVKYAIQVNNGKLTLYRSKNSEIKDIIVEKKIIYYAMEKNDVIKICKYDTVSRKNLVVKTMDVNKYGYLNLIETSIQIYTNAVS